MNGTYTIGGDNPDFDSFKDASDSLKNKGISGAVIFNIRQGVYLENNGDDPVLTLDQVNGVSSVNTITFQPDPVSGASVENVILKRDSSSASANPIVVVSCDHLILRNITILDADSVGASSITAISLQQSFVNLRLDSVTVEGCRILGSFRGPAFSTRYGITAPHTTALLLRDNLIDGCSVAFELGNQNDFSESPRVTGNRILRSTYWITGTPQFAGQSISIRRCNNAVITNNIIDYQYIGGGSLAGISLNEVNNFTLESNIVRNRSFTDVLFTGISVGGHIGRIVNNMISGIDAGYRTGLNVTGDSIQIFHNSVYLPQSNNLPWFTTSSAFELNGEHHDIRNNIFIDLRVTGGHVFAMRINALSNNYFNNNNLVSAGYAVVQSPGVNYANLIEWQVTGNDLNSISEMPSFANDWSDLHLTSCSKNDNQLRRARITGVDVDIDGDERQDSSFIGADEAQPDPVYFKDELRLAYDQTAFSSTSGNFDSDSDLDIAVAYWENSKIEFWESDGNNGFTKSTSIDVPFRPTQVKFADMDNDTFTDLIVGGDTTTVFIFYTDGSGNITDTAAGASPYLGRVRSFEISDLRKDGDLDIVVSKDMGFGTNSGVIDFYENQDDADLRSFLSFYKTDTTYKPLDLVVTDFNGDDYPDVAALNSNTGDLNLYTNNFPGDDFDQPRIFSAFVNQTSSTSSIADLDYDNDDDTDLAFISADSDSIMIFTNDGSGNFTNSVNVSSAGSAPRTIISIDADDDGSPDIITGNLPLDRYGVSVYRNQGNGEFELSSSCNTPTLSGVPVDMLAADLNNDDKIDLAIAGGDTVFILHNQGYVFTSVKSNPDHTKDYRLFQNYPNPFNPATTISFGLPYPQKVILKIYDVLGKEVTTLFDDYLSAGKHSLEWNAGNLPSGVYFFRIEAGNFIQSKKLLLLK